MKDNSKLNQNNQNTKIGIENEDFIIKTGEQSIYDAVPGAFFDENIFKYLSSNKNLNTKGRQQNFHSVTLFPYNKKTNKIDMTSYLFNPNQPFSYYGGDGDNKIIGLIPNLKKKQANILEGGGNDIWSTNDNVGKGQGLTRRVFNNHGKDIFVKQPKKGQKMTDFVKEEMTDYDLKNKIIDLRLQKENAKNEEQKHKIQQQISQLAKRCKSPLKIITERDVNSGKLKRLHVVNESVYDKINSNGNRHDEAMQAAQRVSRDVETGKTWQQYNEYIVNTPSHTRRNSVEIDGIMIDARKPVKIKDKNKLINNINEFIEYNKTYKGKKKFNVYKIEKDNHVTLLNNKEAIKQTIKSFPDLKPVSKKITNLKTIKQISSGVEK